MARTLASPVRLLAEDDIMQGKVLGLPGGKQLSLRAAPAPVTNMREYLVLASKRSPPAHREMLYAHSPAVQVEIFPMQV